MNDVAGWDARYSDDGDHIAKVSSMLSDLKKRSGTLGAIRSLRLDQARVLEIGCGTGQHSVALATECPQWQIDAIDMAPRAVTAACRLCESVRVPVHVALGDATRLPYEDGIFDVVFGDHVLGHIPDRGSAEREIVRVLKPGGFAIFNSGNALRPDGWPLYHLLTHKPYLARTFFPWTLSCEFRRLGCVRVGSYGSTLILTRGLSLIRPSRRRASAVGVMTGTVAVSSSKPGFIRRMYRYLDAHAPAWCKTDFGIVMRKL